MMVDKDESNDILFDIVNLRISLGQMENKRRINIFIMHESWDMIIPYAFRYSLYAL